MLRKALTCVSLSVFIGVCVVSFSGYSVPQLEIYRTALFKSQGLVLRAIGCSWSNLGDKFTCAWSRHVPRSWNLIRAKFRIEIPRPTTCCKPGRSVGPAEPETTAADSRVESFIDAS
jgi:hypothetical protein